MISEVNLGIEYHSFTSEMQVNLFDKNGRIVSMNLVEDKDVNVGYHLYKISLEDVEAGVYSLEVNMDSQKQVLKLVVAK